MRNARYAREVGNKIMNDLTIDPKAVARVKDKLPIPTSCRFCGGVVTLESNSVVYGQEYGKWPYMYLCDDCRAYVAVHPKTDIPMGTLANRAIREARVSAKNCWKIWARGMGYGRSEAYENLAKILCIPVGECHFGWFDTDMCDLVIFELEDYPL